MTNVGLDREIPNQPSKFRTKNWVEVKDDSSGTYSTNSQIKFKTSTLKSSLYGYSDAYMLVEQTIKITGVDDAATRLAGKRGK